MLSSLNLTLILLIAALLLSCSSILMNLILWRKLRRYEQHERKNIPDIVQIQRGAKQKLLVLKKDLQRQGKELEYHGRKDISTEDAAHLERIREHLSDAEAYIDQKIRDVEKR
jgi:hypothetical protein